MSRFTAQIEKIIAEAEEEGFQRGWKAARDALDAPVSKIRVAGNAPFKAPKKKRKKPQKQRREVQKVAATGTVQQRVVACIEANPGKTGAEIIRLLGEVNPRTVRTMFRRLRLDGQIMKNGEGWFKK